MRLAIAFLALAAAAGPARAQQDSLTVRIWQFDSTGFRHVTGRRVVHAPRTADIRFVLGAPTRWGFGPPYRLDATLSMYDQGDTTVVGGIVAAGRVVVSDSRAAPVSVHSTIDEHRYLVHVRVARGAPVWLFPFGKPQRGQRGFGLELQRGDVGPAFDLSTVNLRDVLVTMQDLSITTRRGRVARIRIDTGPDVSHFTMRYDGPIHPLSPITFDVPGSGRGPLAIMLGEPPWFTDPPEMCVGSYWVHDAPRPNLGCIVGRATGTVLGETQLDDGRVLTVDMQVTADSL